MSAWRLFLASWVVLLVTSAEAGELQFRERFSGSLVNTTIDTNRDGFPGYLATVAGTSSLGAISVQDATELAPAGTCSNGDLRLTLVAGHSVKRVTSGDLLLVQWASGAFCVNPISGLYTLHLAGHFSGGTGRFSTATDPVEITVAGTFLTFDSTGFFGSATGEGKGTIITRDDD